MTDRALIERMAKAMNKEYPYAWSFWEGYSVYKRMARVALRVVVHEQRRRRRAASHRGMD